MTVPLTYQLLRRIVEMRRNHRTHDISLSMNPMMTEALFYADDYRHNPIIESDGRGKFKFAGYAIKIDWRIGERRINIHSMCDCRPSVYDIIDITNHASECTRTITINPKTRRCVKCDGTGRAIVATFDRLDRMKPDRNTAAWPAAVTVPQPRYARNR